DVVRRWVCRMFNVMLIVLLVSVLGGLVAGVLCVLWQTIRLVVDGIASAGPDRSSEGPAATSEQDSTVPPTGPALPSGPGWAPPGHPQHALQRAMYAAVNHVPGQDPSSGRHVKVVYGRDGVGRIETGP